MLFLQLVVASQAQLVEDVEILSNSAGYGGNYDPPDFPSNGNNGCLAEYALSSFHLTSEEDEAGCLFRVAKVVPTVCSLDLEFNQFEVDCDLGGLDVQEDELLCGDLTGQTIRLPFEVQEVFDLRVILLKDAEYNITVRQIDCPGASLQEPVGDGAAPIYTQFQDFTARVSARLGEQKIGMLHSTYLYSPNKHSFY